MLTLRVKRNKNTVQYLVCKAPCIIICYELITLRGIWSVGNIIPVFFPIMGWIIHLPAYLQETEFIITRYYVQYVQNTIPQNYRIHTQTHYVHEHDAVKVGVVTAE